AVIEAAQPALLVAAQRERSAAVGAELAQHAHAPVAVAEDDQVLSQQPRAHRGAVTLRDFLRHARGQPVPSHELAHRAVALDPAQQLVLVRAHRDILDILRALSIYDSPAPGRVSRRAAPMPERSLRLGVAGLGRDLD